MKKVIAVLFFVIFAGSISYAALISADNVEVNIPDNWKAQFDVKKKNLLIVAGLPSTRSALFYTDEQLSPKSRATGIPQSELINTDENDPAITPRGRIIEERYVSVNMELGVQFLEPAMNIYKMPANGQSLQDYKAAETMTFRVKTGAKILDSKDNYVVVSYQDGMRDVARITYFYVKNDMLYIVLFESNQKNFNSFLNVFRDINKSLKIK